VTDAFSNGIPGVTVTFTVTSGGGSIAGATAVTDAGGNATAGPWTLGQQTGTQIVVATMANGQVATFTATAVDPAALTMSRFAGDNTTCPVSTTGCSFTVLVRNGLGTPVQGESIVWTNGTQTLTTTTNSRGRSTVPVLAAAASASSGTQRARLVTTGQEVTFSYQHVQPGGYNIELRFLVTPSASQQNAFVQAKQRWESVITGDIPQWSLTAQSQPCGPITLPAFSAEPVDDLIIYVQVDSIDGPGEILGSAGPCYLRPSSGFPILGIMRLDRGDLARMEIDGTLRDVITHEMGHVIGIGSLWEWNTFQLLAGAGGSDPHFTGMRGISSFQLTGGILTNGVPVENSGGGGTRDSHWRETAFDRELMTGFIDGNGLNPLSVITVASLMDMGYQVNFGAADPYLMPGTQFYGVRAPDTLSHFRLNELPMPRPQVAR
jgi:hypothetical protein